MIRTVFANVSAAHTALALALIVCGALPTASLLAQGAYMSAAGPVHRGMGGASTAAPLDALGALYWNPATISGLSSSELGFGMDLLYSRHELSSAVGGFSGAADSDNGLFPVPNIGWVHRTADPAVTVGIGLNSVAGFKTNLQSDLANPVLMPAPLGLGRVSSEASFCQITPVVSLVLTDRLSIGIGPTITMGQLAAEPMVFQSPNGDGRYSSARSTRYHWGGGAQAGAYFLATSDLHLGASIKSPQWMETFRFYGQDELGGSRELRARFELPMILSVGAAYKGMPGWTHAVDVRYFGWGSANGFGDPAAYNPDGSVQGIGWKDVVSVAVGSQRQVSHRLALRGGYTYNESPIGNDQSFFNVASPLIYEHMLSGGATLRLWDGTDLNFGYSYYLPNEVRGPIVTPLGPIPGSSVTNRLEAHQVSFGVSRRY